MKRHSMNEMAVHNIGLIVQARMESTRLPGKILMPIGKYPLLEHICRRMADVPGKLVIATSTRPANDAVEAFCQERSIAYFRGPEENVLERYVLCACHYGFQHVVRLTGDNPFPDAYALQRLVRLHLTQQADFSTSFGVLPIGVGCEVFRREMLEYTLHNANKPHHFEHVDEYLLEHKSEIRNAALPPDESTFAPEVRLTVDYVEDLVRARCIVAHAGEMVNTKEAIRLCRSGQC